MLLAILVGIFSACGTGNNGNGGSTPPAQTANVASPQAQNTASNKFTEADIAKLKWIEGTWRGMDGDKPFFERYRFENETAMIVETLADDTLAKVSETSRFQLLDGEFTHTEGNQSSAASSITDKSVQFVPTSGGGNSFRFERQSDGTWNAILEWPSSPNKPAGSKVYKMEPWPKK